MSVNENNKSIQSLKDRSKFGKNQFNESKTKKSTKSNVIRGSALKNDPTMFICEPCKMLFPDQSSLIDHEMKNHKRARFTIIKTPLNNETEINEKEKRPQRRCIVVGGGLTKDTEQRQREKKTINEENFDGFRKNKNGQYSCNSCDFRSIIRSIVRKHVDIEHAFKIEEAEDDDDEDDWPIDAIDNYDDDDDDDDFGNATETLTNKNIDENNESETKDQYNVKPDYKTNLRYCPYCTYTTYNVSTYHSHVKRKHPEEWIASFEKKASQSSRTNVYKFFCNQCTFKAVRQQSFEIHMFRRHGVRVSKRQLLEAAIKEANDRDDKLNDDDETMINETKNDGNDGMLIEQYEYVLNVDNEKEEEEGGGGDREQDKKQDVTEDQKVDATTKQKNTIIPRRCLSCSYVCLNDRSMRAHVSVKHGGTKKMKKTKKSITQKSTGYACNYCTFVAATIPSINTHMTREHVSGKPALKEVPVNEYDCDKCEFKSKNRKVMQLHLNIHTVKANEDGMYSCYLCFYETSSRMGLERHITVKHNKPRRDDKPEINYKCDRCDFECPNGKMLDWHIKQHDAPSNTEVGKIYYCEHCEFSTWSLPQLGVHLQRKHKPEDMERETGPDGTGYPCKECEHVSKNKHSLKVHVLRKHRDEYNHECDQCGKKYKVKADLTNHVRFQHREQPIICDVCGKTCRNSNLLYLHQKFAHYKPNFECHICRRRMVTQANLDEHILKQHEERQDVSCRECGKMFTKRARLKIHMRVHTGVKPYSCKICGKAFARRNGLRQHLLTHSGQRPYQCDICGKAFTQKTGLISHRKSHPGNHPPLPRVTIDHVINDMFNEDEA